MEQNIALITLLVDDYDEAIDFYTTKIGFELTEDTVIDETKRWVIVKPIGRSNCGLLLAKATTEAQKHKIGDQTGGRVFLFLYTDDIDRDYQKLISHNVRIVREPTAQPYGRVAVFADLYGNLWDLIEPAK